MEQSSFLYPLSIILLLLIVVLVFMNCGSTAPISKAEDIVMEEMPVDRGIIMGESNKLELVEVVELDNETLAIANLIASGGEYVPGQCLLLRVFGLKEENGLDIGIHIFLNHPDANQQTALNIPQYVNSFSLGDADRTKASDYVFNLKRAANKMGDELLKDLNTGMLTVTLVPYHFFPEDVPDPNNINLRINGVNITSECD